MSEMVKRICDVLALAGAGPWEEREFIAIRCIGAMREPTKEQMKAAIEWAAECRRDFEPIAIGYQRMIDAALAPPPGDGER